MILARDLAKALLNKANEVAAANSYTLIPQGLAHAPSVNETYVTEACIFGENNTLGMVTDSDEIQYGIYQIAIYTPKSDLGYRWNGLSIADTFKSAFTFGLRLSYNGQMLKILETSTTTPTLSDTHMAHVLSVRFNVIN